MSNNVISTEALIAKFQHALDNNWGYIWGTAGVEWTAARQKQLEQTTDADRESGRKYGSKWIGHRVADCSGLFSWVFKELGGYMYHGSNTIWNKYCVAKGELIKGKRDDGKELKPGTAIFTHNLKKDNRGHIGLYIGGGWVIEASGTINGVIKSKLTISKWVEWGELKGVDYDNVPADIITEPEDNMVYGTLRKGDKGPVVKYAQKLLIEKGYSLPKYGVDGDFGSETLNSVKAFQKANGLTADGVIGAKTWAKLQEEGPPKKYSVHGLTKEQAEEIVKLYPGCTMQIEGRQ